MRVYAFYPSFLKDFRQGKDPVFLYIRIKDICRLHFICMYLNEVREEPLDENSLNLSGQYLIEGNNFSNFFFFCYIYRLTKLSLSFSLQDPVTKTCYLRPPEVTEDWNLDSCVQNWGLMVTSAYRSFLSGGIETVYLNEVGLLLLLVFNVGF